MKTETTNNQIQDFVLGLYFDLSDSFEIAAIKRAYRDFNRTLQKFPVDINQKNEIRNKWIEILKGRIDELLNHEFENQEEFTLWHQSVCYELRKTNQYELSQGQAQKWLNMTLKYLFVFGESKVPGITRNYKFYHIPIDNVIMNKLQDFGIAKFEKAWSQIPDYDSYYNYQKKVREQFPNRIPLDVEFELFNQR